jgi:hypothetical protein
MILCQDWYSESGQSTFISIRGLLVSIESLESPAYPLKYAEICTIVLLTECRGAAELTLVCVEEETEKTVYQSMSHNAPLGTDPLGVVLVPFRVKNLTFQRPGVYRFEVWYNGKVLAEQPLRLR